LACFIDVVLGQFIVFGYTDMPGIFTGSIKSVKNQQEAETKRLYEQIGKLQMTVDFLKNAVYPR